MGIQVATQRYFWDLGALKGSQGVPVSGVPQMEEGFSRPTLVVPPLPTPSPALPRTFSPLSLAQ